jgi:YVTN family beta-propeller protein
VAFSPDGASAYVTSTQDGDHSIHVLDTSNGKRVAKIPILQGRYPVDIVAMTVARTVRSLTVAPVQLAPADGTVFDHFPRTTKLRWSPVPSAASYTVEIDCFHCCQAGKWCTDVDRTYKLVPNVRETGYTFGFAGAQPGRWRVWAVDVEGKEGPKSVWWGFRYTR